MSGVKAFAPRGRVYLNCASIWTPQPHDLIFRSRPADEKHGDLSMPHVSERRKKPRRKPAGDGDAAWITIRSAAAGSTDVRAKVVDASDTGFRIETPVPIEVHTVVAVYRGTANGNAKSK